MEDSVLAEKVQITGRLMADPPLIHPLLLLTKTWNPIGSAPRLAEGEDAFVVQLILETHFFRLKTETGVVMTSLLPCFSV